MKTSITRDVIEDAENLIWSSVFTSFLTDHTVTFEAAAFLLDAVIKAVDEAKKNLTEEIEEDGTV